MSLSDIMSASNLAVYPQIALILFLTVFVSVACRVMFTPGRRKRDERAAMLPLEELEVVEAEPAHEGQRA